MSTHKSYFRFEDPFKKDRDLIYKHIGLTKQITYHYQLFLISVTILSILIIQINRHIVKWKPNGSLSSSSISYSFPKSSLLNTWFKSYFNLLIISLYYLINLFIIFFGLPMNDSFNLALRFGLVAVSNIPLLYLIPLKTGPFLYLLNQSYENILIYHKFVGVLIIATSIIHSLAFIYCLSWFYLLNNIKPQTGLFCIFTFILIAITSSFKSIHYEIFYYAHILSFLAFLPVFYFHHYVCKPFVIFVSTVLILDRFIRLIWYQWIFKCHVDIRTKGFLIISVDTNVGKIGKMSKFISYLFLFKFNNSKFSWNLTNHIFITIPFISTSQSHPFTIASIPNPHGFKLIIKIHNGFTKKLYNSCLKNDSYTFTCFIHGPYGLSNLALPVLMNSQMESSPLVTNNQFTVEDDESSPSIPLLPTTIETNNHLKTLSYTSNDSSIDTTLGKKPKIILIAGGTGISLILPVFQFYRYQLDISLIWVLRDSSLYDKFSNELKDPRVTIWITSLKGRPNLADTLYNCFDEDDVEDYDDNISTLYIVGCGPNSMIQNVKSFGLDQLHNGKQVELVLEEFSM